MRPNAGMANSQGDVDLHLAQVSATSYEFGLAWLLFGFLTLEDGADRLSRNVSKDLPLLSA